MDYMSYVISSRAQLVERLNEEPGAFVSGCVERDAHGVLLEQRRKSFVDGEELVALDVQQLNDAAILNHAALLLLVLRFVLFLLKLSRMLQAEWIATTQTRTTQLTRSEFTIGRPTNDRIVYRKSTKESKT